MQTTTGLKTLVFLLLFAIGTELLHSAPDQIDQLFNPGPPSKFRIELQPIQKRFLIKFGRAEKQRTEDFKEELDAIYELIERYKHEFPNEIAPTLWNLAQIHYRFFDDPEGAIRLLKKLKMLAPHTSEAKKADLEIEKIPILTAGWAVFETLKEGTAFPPFETKDIEGQPLILKAYQGKAVVLNFWTAKELFAITNHRNLQEFHDKYSLRGLEVLGINMNEDETLFRDFLRENNVKWRQHFDGKGFFFNEIARKYGIPNLQYMIVLDRKGRIVALDPPLKDDLESAIVKALKTVDPADNVKDADGLTP